MSIRVAILHGAGYTGGELIRLLIEHPDVELVAVTSRAFAGQPLWSAHGPLRGVTELAFESPDEPDLSEVEVVFVAAEHGQGVRAVEGLVDAGYAGRIVDLSADFRFKDALEYPRLFGFEHPNPDLLEEFVYGLPEVSGSYRAGTRYIANPGCFATAITLALWPLARRLEAVEARVTALTGASGSGVHPRPTTHFPTRDGNVRAYKVFKHQHQPEIEQVLGPAVDLSFVPVSGPWTRGIWGTAHLTLSSEEEASRVGDWFEEAYEGRRLIRLWPDQLPELRFSVNTPFCDLGWVVDGRHVVVGFAIDNLLKGAASQAIQNMNLLLDLPESRGLLPSGTREPEPASDRL